MSCSWTASRAVSIVATASFSFVSAEVSVAFSVVVQVTLAAVILAAVVAISGLLGKFSAILTNIST